jgi:hypothetical protein
MSNPTFTDLLLLNNNFKKLHNKNYYAAKNRLRLFKTIEGTYKKTA